MAPPAPAKPLVNDALRREIAEMLLLGTPASEITATIAARGLAPRIVEGEVLRASKSPYLLGADRLKARLVKREWLLANTAKLTTVDTIPRHHQLAAEAFFADFYAANRPVLVTGLVDHWPARAAWSFDGLDRRLGQVEIDVQSNRDSNPDYESQSDRHGALDRLSNVIKRILEAGPSNDFYVTANNSGHNKVALAALWDDIGAIPGWLAPRELRDGFFWMGPAGTITPWHHDLTNNIMVQLVGSKRVKLVAAAETPRMRNTRHCFSAWDGPDLPTGPGDAERPPVLEVTLEPGDVLFLPVGWWHHVEGLTPTIGMSFINFARSDNDFYSHYSSYGLV